MDKELEAYLKRNAMLNQLAYLGGVMAMLGFWALCLALS